ncbi:MAG: hypothetical protein C5S48_09870 [Candidatus Methanogaster sp.]|nr:MAG: hypothetical protein C5S48_09870 [ANME-2 cluster archaeon]
MRKYDPDSLWEVIKTFKKCTLLVTAIFIVSMVSGYLYANSNPYESARIMQELSGELGWITDLDPVLILFAIFLNNAVKSFLVIVLGVLVIVPIIFIVLNGYILGIVMCESAHTEGLLCVAAAILPHGIIELPMVLLSAALGTRVGAMVLLRINGKITTEEILSTLKWSISFYFRWILPLLFVAAVIETFITPAVLWILKC